MGPGWMWGTAYSLHRPEVGPGRPGQEKRKFNSVGQHNDGRNTTAMEYFPPSLSLLGVVFISSDDHSLNFTPSFT